MREIINAKKPLFNPIPEAPEVIESISDLLFDDFGGIETTHESRMSDDTGQGKWHENICRSNFPIGSEERIKLENLLTQFEDVVLVDKLDGTTVPMLVNFTAASTHNVSYHALAVKSVKDKYSSGLADHGAMEPIEKA